MNPHTPSLLVLCLALVSSNPSLAEFDSDNAGPDFITQVRSYHKIVIPEILYLRVGDADENTVNKVKFELNSSTAGTYSGAYNTSSLPFGQGDGSGIDATENGTLDVYVVGNGGPINLSYTLSHTNGLENQQVAGKFIPWSQIITTSDQTTLPAPTDASNTVSTTSITKTITGVDTGHACSGGTGGDYGGKVVYRTAKWTYKYKDTIIPIAGTYEGRISYIATAP